MTAVLKFNVMYLTLIALELLSDLSCAKTEFDAKIIAKLSSHPLYQQCHGRQSFLLYSFVASVALAGGFLGPLGLGAAFKGGGGGGGGGGGRMRGGLTCGNNLDAVALEVSVEVVVLEAPGCIT